jgi:hypothetical protein
MIAAAHREASIGNSDESDDVMVGRKLRESKTISEEMSKLAMEEARLETFDSLSSRNKTLIRFKCQTHVGPFSTIDDYFWVTFAHF